MARTQAADFAERREAIVEEAARLFAERGFLGASIADLAEACGSSKSLVYHYYASKEDILYDVMHSHVKALLDAAEQVAASNAEPSQKLRALTLVFLRLYVGASSRHRVLLNELDRLPKNRRAIVVDIQRRLVATVAGIVAGLRPDLRGELTKPAAMLYFGMINWTHTWMDPKGPANPRLIAALAADIFLGGIEGAEIPE